jgi:hypothetical protein
MRTRITWVSALAAAFVFLGGTVSAQTGKGRVVISDLPAGADVLLEVNGSKPPGGSGVASGTGIVELTLNYVDMAKPEGFKGQVFVDVCRNGVRVRVVSDGTAPAADSDCRRRRVGTIEFRPDGVTRFSGAPAASPLPDGLIGGGGGLDQADMTYSRNLEVWGGRSGATVLPEERNTDVPRNFRNEVGLNGATSLFSLPVRRTRGASHNLIVTFGHGDARLDYDNIDTAADSTRWTGSGPLWGAGYGTVFQLCDGCGWFGNASYLYSRLEDTTMRRSSPLDLDGGTLIRDRASFGWHAHTITGTVGRATSFVFPYAGFRTSMRRAALEGSVAVDFSRVIGFPYEENVSFVNEFESTTTQAIFGAQIRIPNTRIVVRAEGAAGSGSSGFAINAGYGWYR